MDHEFLFVAGICLILLAFVSFVSAWVDNRRPVLASLLGFGGAGLIASVALLRPEGLYRLREVPEVFTFVAARVLALF